VLSATLFLPLLLFLLVLSLDDHLHHLYDDPRLLIQTAFVGKNIQGATEVGHLDAEADFLGVPGTENDRGLNRKR
jgi:hypothetical protein